MDNEEKVFRAYDWVLQRVHQMDRILSERTNIFLLSNSILFAGFVLLYTQLTESPTIIYIVVASVGIILSVQQAINSHYTVREIDFWVRCCRTLEKEDEAFKTLKDWDLIWIGYSKWLHLSPNRFTQVDLKPDYKAKPFKKWERVICLKIPISSTHSIYRYLLPLSFLAVWLTSLVWVL